jgi:hypothetical protein
VAIIWVTAKSLITGEADEVYCAYDDIDDCHAGAFACKPHTQAIVGQQDAVAIRAATLQYVRSQTSVPAQEVMVSIQARAGDMVKVHLQTKHAIADPATAFLQQTSKGWGMVVLATAFDEHLYQQYHIPSSLWQRS